MNIVEGSFTGSDGVEFYTMTVSGDSPKYDLLHVHGLGEHSQRWTERFEQLARRGARVTSFDLRGHGQSSGPRMHIDSFQHLVDDVGELALATAAATGRPWVLYGHSLGGLIVTSYLVDSHTPMPNIAVISAPALGDGTPAIKKAAASLLGGIIPSVTMKTPIAGEQLSSNPKVGEDYSADPLVQQFGSIGFGKLVFAEQKRVSSLVGNITIPALVIHGADDTLVPTSASAPLAKSISVERKVYPGFRHELHFEDDGDRVIGDIGDWIDAKIG